MADAGVCSEKLVTAPSLVRDTPRELINWYAIRTRSRHEKLVRSQFAKQNIEHFLPTVTRRSRWKDRMVEIEFPLFTGYCFARFSLEGQLPVLQTQGVVNIIGASGSAEPIPDSEIESLRILVNSRFHYDPHPCLEEGMLVEVIRGPLQGVKGHLLRKTKPSRLIISIHLIQQAASVEMDASDIAPVQNVRAI